MLFIDTMAAFLDISTDSLRIVSITEGSVNIDYEIILDETVEDSEVIGYLVAESDSEEVEGEEGEESAEGIDACDGAATTIASSIATGSLEFAGLGTVSNLDYTCSTIVEDEEAFELLIEELEVEDG